MIRTPDPISQAEAYQATPLDALGGDDPATAQASTADAATSDEQRARVGLHRERGPESYDLMFRMLAGHDRVLLAQARRAIGSVRGWPTS